MAQRPLAVIVELEGRPDLAAIAAQVAGRPAPQRPGAISAALRAAFDRVAPRVQKGLVQHGALQIEPLWLQHAFAAQVPPAAVSKVAALPGVTRVYEDRLLKAPVRAAPAPRRPTPNRPRPEGKPKPEAAPAPMADPATWQGELPVHLAALGVASFWQRGATGKGVVVAVVDSGVDAREPSLRASFRGGAQDWFDPYGQRAQPHDASGHGTHVANVIAGGAARAGAPPLGVAPHAKWIAARIYDDEGLGRFSAVHRVYQWALDPDGRPDTTDAPQIVNNSWALPQTVGRCDTQFARDFAALRAAGIHVVFAAGNTGPDSNTSVSPANNPGVLAVGALKADGQVAEQSARGPSACGGGPYPQVYAPGVDIESVDAAGRVLGQPLRVTGTSYAAALASGVLALIVAEAPQAAVAERERRLAAALASEKVAAAPATPTALTWRPELAAGALEIDARTLLRVLPWTAKLQRLEVQQPPAQGQVQTLAADRLRYRAGDEQAAGAPFTLLAHTADGRSWRIAVEPQRGGTVAALPSRRLSFAIRSGEELQLSRAQLADDTGFAAVRASQTVRGGAVHIADDGSVRYTPRTGFRGIDQFVCTLLAADGSPRARVQVAVMVR